MYYTYVLLVISARRAAAAPAQVLPPPQVIPREGRERAAVVGQAVEARHLIRVRIGVGVGVGVVGSGLGPGDRRPAPWQAGRRLQLG